MGKKCDYYIDKNNKDWCILKDTEVNRDTYKDFCYYDNMKKCPIYEYFKKEKKI